MATKRKRTTRPRKPGLHKGAVGAGLFATKRGKPKRKSNRKPMSAAARKAFRERMEAARAAKGNRSRGVAARNTIGDASFRPAFAAYATRTGREPTQRGRTGRSEFGRPSNTKYTTRRAPSRDVAILIIEALRGAGFDAQALRFSDRIEIRTNAPEAVCLEAARAAGA